VKKENLEAELKAVLSPEEEILWMDKPAAGIKLKTIDYIVIPFNIIWIGVSLIILPSFIDIEEFFTPFDWFVIFIMALFVIHVNIGRLFLNSRMRKETRYAITENRIIIISELFKKEIRSLNLKTISQISYNEKTDGSGTIQIGPSNPLDYLSWRTTFGLSAAQPKLEYIENVKAVYNKIIELKKR
jgi:hypothetical protein